MYIFVCIETIVLHQILFSIEYLFLEKANKLTENITRNKYRTLFSLTTSIFETIEMG